MSTSNSQPSKSGIVTDLNGERHIPSSTRADGSTRREIKIRPGYRPPEDVEVYRNRTAQAFRTRGKAGVPGADTAEDDEKAGTSASSNKNAKRREARRKAKAATGTDTADGQQQEEDGTELQNDTKTAAAVNESNKQASDLKELEAAAANLTIDDEAEKQKKAKRLKKKLREARELQERKEQGEGLLPEQLQKAIRISEIIRELDQLGFDANGDPKAN